MKILMTGATGLIGKEIGKKLVSLDAGELISGPILRADVQKIFSHQRKVIANLFCQEAS